MCDWQSATLGLGVKDCPFDELAKYLPEENSVPGRRKSLPLGVPRILISSEWECLMFDSARYMTWQCWGWPLWVAVNAG